MRYPLRGWLMSFSLVTLLLVTPAMVTAATEATLTEAATTHSEGCSVTGLVTDHRGIPVAYAIIAMFRDGDEKEALVTASSDRSGKFFLSRLAPGAYRFLAAARGFQTMMSDRTELTPGTSAQMTLTLRPAPDGKHSGVNPVKYQNRRNRGIFNATPVSTDGPALTWQATALASSSGYDTQVAVEATPGLEFGALLRRDWEGRSTTFGGAVRYTTEHHRAIVRSLTSYLTSQVVGEPSASSGWEDDSGFFRRHEVRAADAWQVTPELQLTYGFDYIQVGRSRDDAWLPRLAAQWQPCAQLQFHTALTADGQATPDWTNPESLLFPNDFPNPPQRLVLNGDTPVIARNLRTEVGVAWRAMPHTTVKLFAYRDRVDGHALALTETPVARIDGRAEGGGLMIAYRPHQRLMITTAYAVGRAPLITTAYAVGRAPSLQRLAASDVTRPAPDITSPGTYHIVTVVAETILPLPGARLTIGYRGATGRALHAIDPFASRLPITESGLSFAFLQTLPSWFTLPGRWEAVLEGRNLDEHRGEITGVGASFGFPQRRLVRGGLRVRF